jgi:hypothetical protein
MFVHNEFLSGYQHQGADISTLRTRTELVFETLVFLPYRHLTRLKAQVAMQAADFA